MEALDKALARAQQRLSSDSIKPVIVKTEDDIKRAVAQFDPRRNIVNDSVKLNANLHDNKCTYNVSASATSRSRRDILIEGLDIVKRHADVVELERTPTEVNGVLVKPAPLGFSGAGYNWVDPLIKRWLGGERRGTLIYWQLGQSTYCYDAYKHELTRETNAPR